VTRDTAHENARWPARRWLPLAAGLLVVLGLATADFWVKHRTVIGPTATLEVDPRGGVRPLAPDRLADDRPDRLFWDDDSYYWAAYARTMIEEGRFRIRRTEIDNAPYGREVHWSSGTTWLLAALAPVAEWTGSRGVDHAIADAALVVHPLLFFALAIGTALLAARRLAWWSSVALAGGFLLSPVLSRDLSYGTVDHHGLLLIFLTGTLLCLLVGGAGCVEEHSGESERRSALARSRRWTIASGIFAGAGMWIQAAFQGPLLAAVAGGAVLGALLQRRPGQGKKPTILVPELWRTWGRVAAATSLAFYLVEYFPFDLGMRLEVNHPLYSLALLCTGEIACRLIRLRLDPRRERWIREAPVLGLSVIGAALPVGALVFGPVEWFWPGDPEVRRLHAAIIAYQPPWVLFRGQSPLAVVVREAGALPLFLVAASILVLLKRTAACGRYLLVIALAPSVVAIALYLRYVRNASLVVVTLICLGFAVFRALQRRDSRPKRGATVAVVAAVLVLAASGHGWLQSWQAHYPFVDSNRFSPDWLTKLAYRDVAHALRENVPEEERIALVDSGLAPTLHYFGDIAVTAGLYWENREGERATVGFFAAYDEREARAILEGRGIRYVVLWAIPPAPVRWHRIRYGHASAADVHRTLGARLVESRAVPAWLADVTDRYGPVARRYRIRIYRFDPDRR
jgi:hypothetical protein